MKTIKTDGSKFVGAGLKIDFTKYTPEQEKEIRNCLDQAMVVLKQIHVKFLTDMSQNILKFEGFQKEVQELLSQGIKMGAERIKGLKIHNVFPCDGNVEESIKKFIKNKKH